MKRRKTNDASRRVGWELRQQVQLRWVITEFSHLSIRVDVVTFTELENMGELGNEVLLDMYM